MSYVQTVVDGTRETWRFPGGDPAVVAADRRGTPVSRGGFHLPVHDFSRRFGHRLQVDESTSSWLRTRSWAFQADWRMPTMIRHFRSPNCIVWSRIHIQSSACALGRFNWYRPNSQQPQPHAIVRADATAVRPPTPIQGQHLGPRLRLSPAQHQGQTACHHAERKLVPGNLGGEILWPHQGQFPRGGARARHGKGRFCFLLRAIAWAFHDHGFVSSWPSTLSGSCSAAWPPCTSPSTYPGFGERTQSKDQRNRGQYQTDL